MTGPEHYLAAEQLLTSDPADEGLPDKAHAIAEAQVHATLALAAATALNDFDGGLSTANYNAWHNAAGEPS